MIFISPPSSVIERSGSIVSSASHLSHDREPNRTRSVITKRKWIILFVLVVASFAQGMIFAYLAPFYPQEAREKGATAAQIGLIFGIYPLMVAVFAAVTGTMVGHTGAKLMLIVGLLTAGSTTALFGLLGHSPPGSTFVNLSIIVRVFQAAGDACSLNSVFSIVAQEFPDRISTMAALISLVTDLGITLGPACAGFLYDRGGFQLPFTVLGAIILLCMLGAIIFVPKDISRDSENENSVTARPPYLKLLKSPLTVILLVTSTVSAIGTSMQFPTLEPHLKPFHLSHGQVGMIFLINGAAMFLASLVLGVIADKWNAGKEIIAAGGFVAFLALFLLGPSPLTGIPVTIWLTGVSMAILGIALNMQFVPMFASLNELLIQKGFPDNYDTSGLASGLFQTFFYLGMFLGPITGSLGDKSMGYGWTNTVVAALNLIVGIVFLFYLLLNRKHRRGNESVPLIETKK